MKKEEASISEIKKNGIVCVLKSTNVDGLPTQIKKGSMIDLVYLSDYLFLNRPRSITGISVLFLYSKNLKLQNPWDLNVFIDESILSMTGMVFLSSFYNY